MVLFTYNLYAYIIGNKLVKRGEKDSMNHKIFIIILGFFLVIALISSALTHSRLNMKEINKQRLLESRAQQAYWSYRELVSNLFGKVGVE